MRYCKGRERQGDEGEGDDIGDRERGKGGGTQGDVLENWG